MAGKQDRIEHIDALRGLAALYVVLHHMYMSVFGAHGAHVATSWAATLGAPFLYGRAGVDLFLVISGFVLFHPIASGRRGTEPYGRFLLRRAWRIVPPYWALILLTLATFAAFPAVVGVLPNTDWPTARAVATHLLLIHNVSGSADLYAIAPQTWTIPMEFQLYMSFPLLALAFARWGAVGVAIGTIGLTVVGRQALAHGSIALGAENVWVNSVPGFLALFATGMAAAQLAHEGKLLGRASWLAALSAAGWLGGVAMWHLGGFYQLGDALWGLAAACLILAGRDGLAWLRAPALAALGRFSYSTYLVHYMVLAWLVMALGALALPPWSRLACLFVVGVPTTLVVAYAFHRVFERPFLTTPAWLRSRPASPGDDLAVPEEAAARAVGG